MSKSHFSRFSLYVLLLLVFMLVACGGGSTEEEPTAVATQPPDTPADTAVPPPPAATDVPAAGETAVIQPAESLSSGLNAAPDRATTLSSVNAKPTVAPFAGLTGKEDESAPPQEAAPPTNTPQPTPAPQAGTTGVLIENLASVTICYIYIAPSASDSWGDELLGDANVLDVGANMTIELAPDIYDVRLDDCYGKAVASGTGIEVSEGILPLTASDAAVPAAGEAPITMLNDLDALVCYVFIGPSSNDSWGDDWLGTGIVVSPGNSITFNIPPGTTDMKATDCNFESLSELIGVEVTAEGGAWTLSGAESASTTLELINESDTTVCYVQISLTTATEWGDDWLGEENVIESGDSFIFQLSADTYDLRALDCSEGVISEQYEIAVEGTTTLSIP